MFEGVRDKQNPQRTVPVETHWMEVFEPDQLPRGVFNLVCICSGTVITNIGDTLCHITAPAILCLNEQKIIRITAGHATDVKVISFLPEFLNVNMKLETIRGGEYSSLCAKHSFFQLSPFLTDNAHKMAFRLCEDTHQKVSACIHRMGQNLQEQPDWYWSCRARSYFIDVINILERIFYDYYIDEPADDGCCPSSLRTDFQEILVYINNHLDRRITLSHLYEQFYVNKNKLETLFRQYLKTTLMDYLRQRRFEEACYYLRFTELTGEELAFRTGFSSAQSFCRFFSEMSGSTPEAFRRNVVEKRITDMQILRDIEENGLNRRKAPLRQIL